MNKFILLAGLCAVLLTGCRTSQISGYSTHQLEQKMFATNFVSSTGHKINYRVAVPDYDYDQKIPLIVFLHGSGERGDDNEAQLKQGSVGCILKYMVEEKEYGILIAPQCPVTTEWEGETLQAVYELIEYYKTSALVDTNRVYLTGFSMGGLGTWRLGLLHPESFTAVAPIAGGPLMGKSWDTPVVPDAMLGMNVWAVNYYDDTAVNINYSKKIAAQLWMKNSMSAHLFEYLTGGHTCEIYSQREFLDCIFGSRKLTALYQ